MAEGNKFSERKSRLQDFKASIGGGGGQTQQTQQDDGSQQTGKVFDTPRSLDIPRSNRSGGIELPGITTQYSSTLPKTGFIGAIEQGKVQGNVVLPGINDKPKIENATISDTTRDQQRRGYVRATNNSVDAKSANEKIEDELNSTGKVLGEYGNIIKTYWRSGVNNYQKFTARAIWDSGIAQNFVKKTLKESGVDLSDKSMDSINKIGQNVVNAYKNKINDDFQKIVEKNLDPRFLEKYNNESITDLIGQGDFAGAGYKILRGTTENRQMIPEMALMIALPPVGLAVMGADVYVQENQGTFEDMINNGATYDQAKNGAIVVGMINAGIELFMERLLGGAKWAGATAFRRLILKEVQQEVVRNATKKGFAEILSRGIGEMLRGSFVEGFEEVLQQIVGNAMVKLINPDRKIGEGVMESFEGGFYNFFNAFAGGGKMLNDYSDNKKIDQITDLEAIKYVMEGEQRKAQRMQQAKERMKQRFLNPTMDNGYTPSEEQAEQRANEREENEEFEDEMKRENQEGPNYTEEDEQRFTREGIEEQQQVDELRSRQNEEVTLENEMAKEALSENINEDLGDPRFQKIDEDLQDIKDSLEKMDDNTFFNRIMSSINKGNKNYVVTTDNNGNKSVLRVVERGGNGKGSNGKTITVQVMKPSKKSGNVSVSEFTYTPGNLTTDQKQGIITGFENWGKTGNFSDNTAGNERYQLKYEEKGYNPGVAGKNEKSISGKEGVQQRNKINDETIEQLANKYGVRVDVIKGLIKVLKNGKWNGKDYAYGKYLDQVLTLSEQIKESTAPHELLHAIFDMIDPETKAYLISQVMKSEGWSASKAEEWLADSFSNFFRTGKIEGAPKSTWGKIKIFFKRVRSFINGLGRWRSELEEIFTDIITSEDLGDLQGRIDQNQKLNEAKARMKKRFMEYAKNAEKVQKKAESEGKYQIVEMSDKEKYKFLTEGKPVSVLKGNEFEKSDVDLVTQVTNYYNRYYGGKVNSDQIGDVILNKKGVKDSLSHGLGRNKAIAFKAVPNIIRKGIIIDSRINWKNRGYDSFVFSAPITIGNERYIGLVVVTQHTNQNTNNFYLHEVILQKNLQSEEFKTGMVTSSSNGDIVSILKRLKNANNNEVKYQTVYHGSRAEFDRFDSSHMGEGEGDQVHGRGHYVAVDPKTAKRYAELGAVLYKGKQIGGYDNILSEIGDLPTDKKNFLKDIAYDVAKKGKTVQEAKDDLINKYKGFIKDLEESVKDNEKNLEKLEKSGKTSRIDYNQLIKNGKDYIKRDKELLKIIENIDVNDFSKRHFYEVEIPDPEKADTPTGSNYLEEGKKPTRNQYEKFKNELEKYVKNYMPSRIVHLLDVKYEDLNGWGKANVGGGGGALYDIAETVLGGDKQASKFLESLGYDGIHYYGLRDGEAYVIFNDDDLEITNHEKYQTADDIDPNATSPDQLVEVNDQGLDVMVKFVSEKQKKNALNVSKDLLTKDGNPYMWIHTNKYTAPQFANFESARDSKYKSYTNNQIAWFTNSEKMSGSYADGKNQKAKTKPFKNIDELNKYFKENPIVIYGSVYERIIKSNVRKTKKDGKDIYSLVQEKSRIAKFDSLKDAWQHYWGEGIMGSEKYKMPKDEAETIRKLKRYVGSTARTMKINIKKDADGKVKVIYEYEPELIWAWDDEKVAVAEAYVRGTPDAKYSYYGIIQSMKNPLVVNIRNKDGKKTTWSKLGTVNDIFAKEGIDYDKNVEFYIRDIEDAMDGLSNRLKALEEYWNNAYRDDPYSEASGFIGNVELSANQGVTYMVDNLEELLNDPYMGEDLKRALDTEVYGDLRDYGKTLRDVIIELRNFINTDRNYMALKMLSPEGIEKRVEDMGAPKEVVKMVKNKHWKDLMSAWRDVGDREWRDNIRALLTTNGMDLETNDWVKYALDSGKYDGVIFKDIYDYGGVPEGGWDNVKGGDVIAIFNSNQFKSWDNADPTDSKYISYQKMDSDEKNSDGKKLSNGQAEYFKDSKVRDENGNLLVVYHGTRAGDFTVFKGGKTWSNSLAKVGYRFTPSKEGALKFAEGSWGADGKPRAEEVYLNITNPKIYKPSGFNLLSNEEKEKARDEQRKIYNEKADKADGLDYTKAGGFFHDEFDHPYNERAIFEYLKRSWDYDRKYDGKYGKYDPEEYRRLAKDNNVDFDKILKDFEEYTKAKLDEEKEYTKLLDMKYDDPYENFQYDIYKIDSNYDNNWTKADLQMALNDYESPNKFREKLISEGYDGIIIKGTEYDGNVIGGGARNDQYVAFYSNQIKRTTNLNPTDSSDIRYQTVYHGSQAEFDRFDSSHMGEGEGAQAHGWGHYVAVHKGTAENYANLKQRRYGTYYFTIDGKPRSETYNELSPEEKNIFDTFKAVKVNDRSYEEARDYVENKMDARQYKLAKKILDSIPEKRKANPNKPKEYYDLIENDVKDYIEKFEKYKDIVKNLKSRVGTSSNLYEVDIPDPEEADTPTGWNYLEEKPHNSDTNFQKSFITEEQQLEFYKLLSRYNRNAGRRFMNRIGNLYSNKSMLGEDLYRELSGVLGGAKEASKFLESLGYKGIHYYGGRDGEAYVIFNDDDLEIKNHEKYQEIEYDYDEEGNRTGLKYPDEPNEFDPKIFGEPTKQDKIEEDKEKEKNNAFYDAWMRYNDQNYKEDQLTMDEFLEGVVAWTTKKQEEYDQKMRDLAEAQTDPKMLDLQLRAVKLMEEEQQVGKKFGKNVSKEVRVRQEAEVEKKREQLIKDIFDWMYPGLSFEEATYNDQMRADEKEAEWEMLGKEGIEEKLKYFKKDKNGNWEAKNIKIEDPEEQWNKIAKSGNFDEVFTPTDRVLEWKTPQGQKGRIDSKADPKKFKKIMEKINSGKTKTKVTLRDVTQEARALEKQRAMEEAEKERKKKEQQEAIAKKKQDEYKKLVRMKAFQRLVDMQWFERYPFLTEDEIKTRYGFTDQEWKDITEQNEIKLPKKWSERAVSDFNKAVDSQVKALIEGLSWQNNLKRKDAEKNLGEIGDIDIDVLLGRDEEKGQKEVEEFEKLAGEKRENKKITIEDVKIDEEREQNKDEKKKIDKLIKSTKSDKTVRGSIKEFTSNILTPVSTKIREISPKIHREVMRYFQNKDIKTNERLKAVDPFLKAMKKIRKENPVRFMDIWVNLANRNIGYANGLLQEYGVTVPTELLDTIYDEAQDVGLNINYLGNYFPLSVKAPRKFLEELMKVNKKDIASEIEKKIMEESQKKGGPLEEAEITAIINDVIAGGEQGPDVNIGNAHLKKRNTEIQRTAKMLEYCDDPISTLISYIEGMTQSIERAKFLGKSRSGNVHTLADYVYNAKNGLTPDQQDELMDLLKAVFNDNNPSKAIQTWRDLATLTTLGSPSSTLTQLGDLSFSVYENGWRETLKAVWDVFMKRKAFDLIDMGVLNRGEEYTNINSQRNLLQKAIHNVFKLTFFSTFDTFGKSTFIQSTWNKWTRLARKDDKQLRKDIMKWTDDDYMTDKIINDLKNNNFSEDVALVMYMKLSNIQPLTRAQMPKAYLNNPNGRLFYQFKTFGIKQLDYVLQETKQQTKNFKNLSTGEKLLRVVQIANMVMVMTLLGVGADELKDLTMRRRSNSLILRWLFGEGVGSEQIWEKIEDNVLKLFGLSRYTVMQMKNDPVDAVTSLFTTLPATNIINYPFKDIYKAIKDDGSIDRRNPSAYQLIPIVGKYRYWIYGGGQDKQQEALDKKKKKKKGSSSGGARSRA